jgi:putative tricarboxylic transport membrane protein
VRLQRVDRWLGLVLVLFALAWSWVVVTTIPPGWEGEPGPRGFPLLLGIVLGALGLYLSTSAFLRRADSGADQDRIEPVDRSEVRVVGLTVLGFFAYAFLLDKLGFLVATPAMVAAALWLIAGQRSWPGVLLLAAGLTIGSYLVFGVLMAAHLPEGSWLQLLER